MKRTKKLVALGCIGAMVVCFASCQADQPISGSTSGPSASETVTAQPETQTDSATQTETTSESTVQVPSKLSDAELMELFCTAYNKAKASGSFLGTETVDIGDVYWNNKKNNLLTSVAGMAAGGDAGTKTGQPMPPHNAATLTLAQADVKSIEYQDQGAAYQIKLTPPKAINPVPGSEGAGKLFELLPDVNLYLDKVPNFKWTEGTKDENLQVVYGDGYVEATIEKASGNLTSAKFVCNISIRIKNAMAAGIKVSQVSVPVTLTWIS